MTYFMAKANNLVSDSSKGILRTNEESSEILLFSSVSDCLSFLHSNGYELQDLIDCDIQFIKINPKRTLKQQPWKVYQKEAL